MNHRLPPPGRILNIARYLVLLTTIGTTLLLGQKRGSLLVLADSGATVYVNGQYQGMITSALDGLEVTDLKPGNYGVVLRRLGIESEEQKVEVKPARRSTFDGRAVRTLPTPEVRAPSARPAAAVTPKNSVDGVQGSERFVGLWREQRSGTFGNAHFEIAFQNAKFTVRRFGEGYPSDLLTATNLTDRGGARSFGVVKLEGKVRHYGGTIGMSLVIHAVVRDPLKDLNSDTLAVQYTDVVGGGAKFEGSERGYWVKMKR